MKHLLFFFLFSGSLSCFSQVVDTTQPLRQFDVSKWGSAPSMPDGTRLGAAFYIRPDTLRAICLVTLSPNGIAHSRMGFVVIIEGKRPVYLDCNKKALKLPQVGWDFREVNPNTEK